jgi:hypothetical protein
MAHAREEFALGLVGGLGAAPRALGILQRHALGDVFHHPDHALGLALRIAQDADADLRPQGAVVGGDEAQVPVRHRHIARQ